MDTSAPRKVVVLMAEDDDDYFFLMTKAFAVSKVDVDLRRVRDGEELMDYLRHEHPDKSPRPDAILMDINMPRKNGREALEEIRKRPDLRQIPVIILTTSRREEDKLRCYELGANSYIRKPLDFEALTEMILTLSHYWFETVELAAGDKGGSYGT